MARRVVWYGLGGGLGHLNRSLAILRHFRPLAKDAEILLLISAPYVHIPAALGIPTVRVPGTAEQGDFSGETLGRLVAGTLGPLAPLDLLVVDTFAEGLYRELTPEILAIARRRALIYREGGVAPEADRVLSGYDAILAPYPVSPISDADAVGNIVNRLPSEALGPEEARRRLGLPEAPQGPLLVAMHAGDPGEVLAFFSQVRKASRLLGRPHELRLLTPLPLPGDPWPEMAHVYPASEVLPAADLVLAGAGYNSVAELTLFGKKALYRPFVRGRDVPVARLGDEETIFGPLTAPEDLAALMRAKLDGPNPWPVDERDYAGAQTAAWALAQLLPR